MDHELREVITISVGQGGCQLGNAIWEQYCCEHLIAQNGTHDVRQSWEDENFHTFFEEKKEESGTHFVARNLSVDLDPDVLNSIRQGQWQAIHDPTCLINGTEDAGNNFARGHYSKGKELMDLVNDGIRKLIEGCGNVQGFMVNHSVGGGTGSGLGMLILERLCIDFRKKGRIGFEIYPSEKRSTCIVDPYNSIFSTHWMLDHTDVSLVFDNESLYELCQRNLEIREPTFANMNRLATKIISNMTVALRMDSELNVDINEFQTNLVPFPRLHFLTSAFSPMVPDKEAESIFAIQSCVCPDDDNSVARDIYSYLPMHSAEWTTVTDGVLTPENFVVKYTHFNIESNKYVLNTVTSKKHTDKYMAISVNYRGCIKSQDAGRVVQWVKSEKKVEFVEWCPTGFKIGLNYTTVPKVQNDDFAETSLCASMMGNMTVIGGWIRNRFLKKYSAMYSQRAYVHWYSNEGMEEGEFGEAEEDARFLMADYIDVLTEYASDEPHDSEDEF